jgi:hypothetical protein
MNRKDSKRSEALHSESCDLTVEWDETDKLCIEVIKSGEDDTDFSSSMHETKKRVAEKK